MRATKEEEEDLIKLCFLYMEYRNVFNLHYQKYGHFKGMIKWISNITDPTSIRWIFQKLLNKNYFIKRKKGKNTTYWFNPTNKTIPLKTFTLTFD